MYDYRYNAHCKSQLYTSHAIANYKGFTINQLVLEKISRVETASIVFIHFLLG